MDSNSSIQGQVTDGDWRTQLQPEARHRIVNKIMEMLKRHVPFSGQEGLQELKKIAVRSEETIYTAATCQSDYLRKISLEMLTVETKSQIPMSNSLQSNTASNNKNPQDPDSQSLQPQMQNQIQQQQQQQQMGLQQQSNTLSRDMQQRIPSTPILQQQNIIDQNQLMQTQRVPEVPMSFSSQTGNASDGDWQEEIYQKIKSMNEMYSPELSEMYEKMAAKLQIHDALPQQPKNDQLEKLRFLKVMLERLILFLQSNKNDIRPIHKEKVAGIEKQIVNILNAKNARKPLQQGQLSQAHMHAMQQSQQQQPQISQVHSGDGQMNSQVQAMDAQSSTGTTQHNNLTNTQHNSSVLNPRQYMMDMLQPVTNIDPGQGNALTKMQQVAMSSPQQNPVSGTQQMSMNSILSQNGLTTLQSNVNNPLQSDLSILQTQLIKHEQQFLAIQQLMQQNQQLHQMLLIERQQQMTQFNQRNDANDVKMMQQQLMQLQQQMMQFNQGNDANDVKMRQQQQHTMQFNQRNDANDVKMRHQMRVKSGVLPLHTSSDQRPSYHVLESFIFCFVVLVSFVVLVLLFFLSPLGF